MKRNTQIKYLICLSIVLVTGSCKDNSVGPAYSLKDLLSIMPHTQGYSWTFREIYSTDFASYVDTGTLTRTIVKVASLSFGKSVRMEETVVHSGATLFYPTRFESIEKELYLSQTAIDSYRIMLKLPLVEGTRWFTNGLDTNIYSWIAKTDTTVELFTRKYEHGILVKSNYRNGTLLMEYIIVPTIGIIYEKRYVGRDKYQRELLATNF